MAGNISRPLVIVGAGGFAEVAAEYFELDGGRKVAGFAVERKYLDKDTLLGRPVVALEAVGEAFPADAFDFFAAITYQDLNRQRRRLHDFMCDRGYRAASYVSSRAFLAPSARLGDHCFVMENNVVQPRVLIGDNVVLWSGNHIGHHTSVADDCFVSSHVVLSGSCRIGPGCFLGVNAAVGDGLTLGRECWLGPGAIVTSDLAAGSVCRSKPAKSSKVSSWRLVGIDKPTLP